MDYSKPPNEKNLYLDLLKDCNITPNFFVSEEYFQKAELSEAVDSGIVFISDKEWGLVFPPINVLGGHLATEGFDDNKIWSDFPEWKPDERWKPQFLDYEYVFNPKDFLTMEGGNWSVFRKNCRKWPRRFGNKGLRYDWINSLFSPFQKDELTDVLVSWLEGKPERREIDDDEVMEKYLFHGRSRKILHHRNKIYGVNIWDENYEYVNFRFSICRSEDYLSEYMRWLFYTDPDIYRKNKLVNDGGTLGNPKLEFFKDKMNPISKREVFSWVLE